ncbi:SAM-dependent methyltransferase [Microbacterium sp. NPDC055683]
MPAIPVYHPGDRLSLAELTAARIDGEVVALGACFLPADAAAPPATRAASIAPLIGPSYAFVRRTAAWIHGACEQLDEPIDVQRAVPAMTTRIVDRAVRYHDQELPSADAVLLGGCRVSSPARTLADLARLAVQPGADPSGTARDAAALLARDERTRAAAIAWFADHRRRPHAVAALALLRRQDDVTR